MSPVELDTRPVEGNLKPELPVSSEFAEFVVIKRKKVVNAFYDARALFAANLEIDITNDDEHRDAMRLPVKKGFTPPGSDSEEVVGPDVSKLVAAFKEKQKKDKLTGAERRTLHFLEGESTLFWEVPHRKDDAYIAARIEHEIEKSRIAVPNAPERMRILAVEKILKRTRELDIQDNEKTEVYSYLDLQRVKEEKEAEAIDFQVRAEKNDANNSEDNTGKVGIDSPVSNPIEDERLDLGEHGKKPKKIRRLHFPRFSKRSVAVGTGLAIMAGGVAEAEYRIPTGIERIDSMLSLRSTHHIAAAGVNAQLEIDESTSTTTLYVASPGETTTSTLSTTSTTNVPEAKQAKPEIKSDPDGDIPGMIETVKNKRKAIVAAANKAKIDPAFLEFYVMLRSAGNSHFGDHEGSDLKGLTGLSKMLADDMAERLKMKSYDLFNDDDNLALGGARLAQLKNNYGGMETNDQISGIIYEFETGKPYGQSQQKTENSAYMSALYLKYKQNDTSALEAWVLNHPNLVRDARISQGLSV